MSKIKIGDTEYQVQKSNLNWLKALFLFALGVAFMLFGGVGGILIMVSLNAIQKPTEWITYTTINFCNWWNSLYRAKFVYVFKKIFVSKQ